MDLKIKDQLFIITGASSGLGNAVARVLLENQATVIAVARREEKLQSLCDAFPAAEKVIGDLTETATHEAIEQQLGERKLSGLFINAGGPPALSFLETSMEQWDEAYALVLRWKVALVKRLLLRLREQHYGRVLFSESSTLKQPIENLVLSNALRMAVAGMAKTLSQEVASDGVTVNIIGPGFHETEAVERLFRKKSELEGISFDEARAQMLAGIPLGRIGDPMEYASLAAWLLSPLASFVTGQVYTLDGELRSIRWGNH